MAHTAAFKVPRYLGQSQPWQCPTCVVFNTSPIAIFSHGRFQSSFHVHIASGGEWGIIPSAITRQGSPKGIAHRTFVSASARRTLISASARRTLPVRHSGMSLSESCLTLYPVRPRVIRRALARPLDSGHQLYSVHSWSYSVQGSMRGSKTLIPALDGAGRTEEESVAYGTPRSHPPQRVRINLIYQYSCYQSYLLSLTRGSF